MRYLKTISLISPLRVMLAVVLTIAACKAYAGEGAGTNTGGQRVAVTVVWDTSPKTTGIWADMLALAKQAVTALKPGDRLEVVSAHHGDGRLRLSQEIKAADAQEVSTIVDLLQNIQRGKFFATDIASALELAFQRIDRLDARHGAMQVVVVVLTDGDIANDQIDQILKLATVFRARGWSLHFIGKDDTARRLLVAASQGELAWSLVSKADPAKWLDEIRKAAEQSSKDGMPKTVPPTDHERNASTSKPSLTENHTNKESGPPRDSSTRPSATAALPITGDTLPPSSPPPSNPLRPAAALADGATTSGAGGVAAPLAVARLAYSPVLPARSTTLASGTGELAGQGRPAPSVIPPTTTPTAPQVHAGPAGAAVATTPRPTVMSPAPAVIAERAAGDERGQVFTAKPPQPVVPDDPAGNRPRPAASNRPPSPPTASAPSAAPAKAPTPVGGPTTAGVSAQAATVPPGRQSRPANTRTGATENGGRPLPAGLVGTEIRPAGELQSRLSAGTREAALRQDAPQAPRGTGGPNANQAPAPRATAPDGSWWASMWSRARQCWQACVGAIVVAAVMAVVILTRLVAARRWYSNLPARLQGASAKPRPPQVLIAQFNGHTYQLGQAGRVHRLHIGSGRGNGIRIQDSTVAPRHLQLRKTRRGLMLRNLARTPVLVNQQELKPRRRQPLVLPATVRLSDRITVSLRAKAEGQPDQSGENQP